jgi:hypothetical protein
MPFINQQWMTWLIMTYVQHSQYMIF